MMLNLIPGLSCIPWLSPTMATSHLASRAAWGKLATHGFSDSGPHSIGANEEVILQDLFLSCAAMPSA